MDFSFFFSFSSCSNTTNSNTCFRCSFVIVIIVVVVMVVVMESKGIPVTGRCEMLRIPQCLDNCDKVVSYTHRPRSTPEIIFLLLVLISVRG
jgi:predicted nucleic acid-binding Zn ribbon protein